MPAEHQVHAGARSVLDSVRAVVHENRERGPGALSDIGSHPGEHPADLVPCLGVVDADDANRPPLGTRVAQDRHSQRLEPRTNRVASDVALVVAGREEGGSGQCAHGIERVGGKLLEVDQIAGHEHRVGLELVDPAHDSGKKAGAARSDVNVAHLHQPHRAVEPWR